MEKKETDELWKLCVEAMRNPSDAFLFEKLIKSCRTAGTHLLRTYHFDSPTQRKMVYRKYDGTGMISPSRTLTEFITKGRRMESVMSRTRTQLTKKLNMAVLYDDSTSMTAWWRNKYFAYKQITEETAPQTSAKIGCFALLEAFGNEADIVVITFGSDISGPFIVRNELYKELVKRNGSGGTRVDMALQKLMNIRWHDKAGLKLLIVFTDGLPETGKRVHDEDAKIQQITLNTLKLMLDAGVQILWIPIFTDERLMHFKIGDYDAKSFTEKIGKMGVKVAEVRETSALLDTLFAGLKALTTEIAEMETRGMEIPI
jgi:hypothetical protein